jgi:Ca2+-binding EF-hand superfamily protein
MNRLNTKISMLVILIAVFSGLTACHHHYDRDVTGFDNNSKAISHISRELSLNPEQTLQLEELLSGVAEMIREQKNREELRRIIIDELQKENLNKDLLLQTVDNYINDIKQASQEVITQLAEFHENLSNEQKVELASLMENDKRGKWRHRNHY